MFWDLIFPLYCMASGMIVMYIWMKYGKQRYKDE